MKDSHWEVRLLVGKFIEEFVDFSRKIEQSEEKNEFNGEKSDENADFENKENENVKKQCDDYGECNKEINDEIKGGNELKLGIFGVYGDEIGISVLKLITDSHPKVRVEGKTCFVLMTEILPEKAEWIVENLEPAKKKMYFKLLEDIKNKHLD